jgi:hypothetical protein
MGWLKPNAAPKFARMTNIRPSAMFGPGDALFGILARRARLLPVLLLIGGGHTRAATCFLWRTWPKLLPKSSPIPRPPVAPTN